MRIPAGGSSVAPHARIRQRFVEKIGDTTANHSALLTHRRLFSEQRNAVE